MTAPVASGVEALEITTAGGVRRITLNRPERKNAVDFATLEALGLAIEAAGADPQVRAIILAGNGGAFCAGADLAASVTATATPEETMAVASRGIRAVLTAPVPVIAEVDGPAVGYGVSLAVAADLLVMSESAYLVLGFVPNGLMPDGGTSQFIPALVGRARAAKLMFFAEKVTGAQAFELGIANAVVDSLELAAQADAWAARIAAGPRRAQQLTKQALVAPVLADLDATLAREGAGQAELLAGPEFREAITARMQKRAPSFT